MTGPANAIQARERRRGPSWMTTLADLLALLLTFFVLLVSMNAVEAEEWQSIVAAFRDQFNPTASAAAAVSQTGAEQGTRFTVWGQDLDYLAALLRHKLARSALAGADVRKLGDRVVIALPSERLFAADGDAASARAKEGLAALAAELTRLDNALRIAGRAGASGGRPEGGASFWAESLRRAETVAEALKRAGYDRPVTVVGYGASRGAAADRVEIAVMQARGEGSDAL